MSKRVLTREEKRNRKIVMANRVAFCVWLAVLAMVLVRWVVG